MKRKFLSARETARVLGQTLAQTIAHFEEAEQSHDQIETALRNHLRASRDVGSYRWLRAVYDSFFVWEQTDDNGVERLYRADYNLDAADAVTVGASTEVQMIVSYVAMGASSESFTEDSSSQFDIGDRVDVSGTPHMEGQTSGIVREVVKTYTYGIAFDGMPDMIHHWYIESELSSEVPAATQGTTGASEVPATTQTAGEKKKMKGMKHMKGMKMKESLSEAFVGAMREAKIGKDGMVLIKIIDAGVGSCGFYSAEVLKAACEANKFPVGLQMFANHQTNEERVKRPEGEIEKIVAITRENGYWDENGPDGSAVYAKAQITQHWRPTMESLADDIGTSWDGSCAYTWGEVGGKEMPIVSEILNVKSVDFVTRAGRGGKIMSLQEAARDHDFSEAKAQSEKSEPDKSPADQSQNNGGDTEMNEAEIKAAKEAAKTEGVSEGHKAGMIHGVETFKAAQKIAREAVAGLALPESVKELLIDSQTNDLGALPMKESKLDGEALSTRVKDAAEKEALRARESYGWGGGDVQHQSGETKTANAREAGKFAEVDAALAGYIG